MNVSDYIESTIEFPNFGLIFKSANIFHCHLNEKFFDQFFWNRSEVVNWLIEKDADPIFYQHNENTYCVTIKNHNFLLQYLSIKGIYHYLLGYDSCMKSWLIDNDIKYSLFDGVIEDSAMITNSWCNLKCFTHKKIINTICFQSDIDAALFTLRFGHLIAN